MSESPNLRQRAAGKWQIPLLMASLTALAGALLSARTAPQDYPPEDAIGQLDALAAAGEHAAAARLASTLIRRSEAVPEELAGMHLRLARSLHAVRRALVDVPEDICRRIATHYAFAIEHGQEATGADHQAWAEALSHEGVFADAVRHYEEAFELSSRTDWDCLRAAIGLRRTALREAPETLVPRLDSVLASAADRPDLRIWALEELVELLHEAGRDDEAMTLVARHRESFADAGQKDTLDYLTALTMSRRGAASEAELLARALLARQASTDPAASRSVWLLGRITLGEDGRERPAESIAHFEESLRIAPHGPYAAASLLGIARALTALERDDEAVEQYRQALAELSSVPESREIDANAVRTSLLQQAALSRLTGRFVAALDYLDTAGPPTQESSAELSAAYWELRAEVAEGHARKLRAELASEPPHDATGDVHQDSAAAEPLPATDGLYGRAAVKIAFETAGESYLQLERLGVLDERRAADAHFRAAEMYAEAPLPSEAARLFGSFVAEHPLSPSVGHALLRLGQVRQGNHEFPAALQAYEECASRFAGTLYGAQALIPLAETYLSMAEGQEELDRAEATLGHILEESDLFRPESREFADALFLRGQIASLKGEHDRAISILTEALDRYPDDERRLRAKFLLADAYRQSGLAMKESAKRAMSAGEGAQLRSEYEERFTRAKGLFREVIDAYETRPPGLLGSVESAYYRHALLFEADCLFENVAYPDALKLYQSAAGALADTPAVLATYVQIINCHVFLGQLQEARTALTRAQVQLERIPEGAFDETFSKESKADWKRYFEWLDRAELF